MERDQAHQDLPDGRLWPHRVPGWGLRQQSNGEARLGVKHVQPRVENVTVWSFLLSPSTFESPTTPSPTTCCT